MGSINVRVVGDTVTHIEPVLKGSETDNPEAPTGDPTDTGGKSSVGGSPAVDNGASNPDNIADSTKLVQDTDKRKDNYVKWNDDYFKRISDDYKTRLWEGWNKDLPRDGQLTGVNFGTNVKLSRAADAYNNRRHLVGTDIGHRTLHYGSTGTGVDREGSTRWQPIETQEQRQMRENERVNERVRNYDTDRQNAIKNYNYDLSRDQDRYNLGYNDYESKAIADIYNNAARLRQDKEYAAQYQQYLDKKWAVFEEELRIHYSLEKTKLIMEYAKTNTAFAQLLTTMIGSNERIPDPMSMRTNIMQSKIFNELCNLVSPDYAQKMVLLGIQQAAYNQAAGLADTAKKAAGEMK